MIDPYVYPGTNILRNVLDIRDKQTLDDAEADYVSLRLRELAENPLDGDYDFAHMTKMHQYIFQDIYEWAGKGWQYPHDKYGKRRAGSRRLVCRIFG